MVTKNNSYMNCGNLYNKHNINNINVEELENNIKNIYKPKILKMKFKIF